MELGLSLGDTSKLPFPFLHKTQKNMVNKDLGFCMGLGLNHGLSTEERRASSSDPLVQLDLLPVSPVVPRHQQPSSQLRLPWLMTNNLRTEPGSLDRSGKTFDVNRFPAALEEEEEEEEEEAEEGAAVSSPNSTVSSFQMDFSIYRSSGGGRSNNNYKRDHIETISGTNNYNEGENDVERGGGCSRGSDDEDNDGSTRKKLRLTKDQSAFLEESFKEHNTLNPKQKLALAKQLNLRPRQVEVWFQNRRARTKLKQTEVDCEYLKRCCETLTEENRRLQKELQELRTLKTSQPFFMQLPATTLTMCPSCERVATTTTTTSAATGTTTTTTAIAAKTATTTATNAASTIAKSVLYPFITHAKNSHAHQAQTHQAAS